MPEINRIGHVTVLLAEVALRVSQISVPWAVRVLVMLDPAVIGTV
jgi:hypothetical protein